MQLPRIRPESGAPGAGDTPSRRRIVLHVKLISLPVISSRGPLRHNRVNIVECPAAASWGMS